MAATALLIRCFPPSHYSLYPTCPFRALTGWRCPGCGSTRAVAALLAGHWSVAWHYNALAVLVAAAVAALAALEFYSACRYGRWRPVRIPPAAAKGSVAAAVLFGVLRDFMSR